jgi:signal transduction histidine kinase
MINVRKMHPGMSGDRLEDTSSPQNIAKSRPEAGQNKAKPQFYELLDRETFLALQRFHNLGVLASGLAHEFNNSMMTILVSIGLLRQLSPLTSEQQKLLEKMQTAVVKASQSTARFIEYAHAEKAAYTEAEINIVVKKAFDLVAGRIPRSVTPILNLSPHSLLCPGDPALLEQALINCLMNSAEALRRGGYLHVKTARVDLQVQETADFTAEVSDDGGFAEISILDSGDGLPEALLQNPWIVLQSTKEMGRGLGLPAARAIVEKYHGILVLEPNSPQGTRTLIYLPLNRDASEAATTIFFDSET